MDASVQIPGYLSADVEYETEADGTTTAHVIGFTFTPAAADAGYFGPLATSNDDVEALNVGDTTAAFWTAVRQALGTETAGERGSHQAVTWAQVDVTGHSWTETYGTFMDAVHDLYNGSHLFGVEWVE